MTTQRKKFILLILFVALVLVVYFLTPLKNFLNPEGFHKIRAWIHAQGALGPLFYGIFYVAACLFALPGVVLTVSGGILFGTLWGSLITQISATLGATLAFLLSRYLGRDFVEKLIHGRLLKLDQKIAEHGFAAVLTLRLVPLFPFNFLNFSLGLTRVKFRDYLMGTLLGIAPAVFIFSSLGDAATEIDFKNPKTWTHFRIWGPFAGVIVLSLIPQIVKRIRKRNLPAPLRKGESG